MAHRTSPTNMGLALLANLSAYDFGYIPAGQLIERTASALRTMQSMERHRGHFYNWYDTLSLKPLHPAYVSTVDSGNLAGHLLTLRPGLLALPDRPILEARWFEGLRDTLGILADAVGGATPAALAHFRKIWTPPAIPGQPRSRRRGSPLTGWRHARRVAGSLDAVSESCPKGSERIQPREDVAQNRSIHRST